MALQLSTCCLHINEQKHMPEQTSAPVHHIQRIMSPPKRCFKSPEKKEYCKLEGAKKNSDLFCVFAELSKLKEALEESGN